MLGGYYTVTGYNPHVMATKKTSDNTIILNKKARYDFFVEETLVAGLVLEGWEVKSLRAGRVQIVDSHVIIRHGEAFLLGALINALPTASTHITPDPTRTRKLLLHRKELNKLIGAVERKGYTIIPLKLFWSHGVAKCEIGLGKGKKQYDKRATEKKREWERDKARIMKSQ
jgi:SsrA-binding protein